MGCEKLDQNVSRRVPVAIKMRVALGAVEALITAQLVMQMSTCSAGLGGVLFRDDVHLAPRVLACLVQKVLPEAEVAQSQHGFRCLRVESSARALDHLLRLEDRQHDHAMRRAECSSRTAVQIVDAVPDLGLQANGRAP